MRTQVESISKRGFAPRLAALLVAALVLAGVHNDATARQQKPQPTVEAADLAQRIHKLVNENRRTHDLPSLARDERLSQIAANHSRDMSSRDFLDHQTPEGKNFPDRYRQAGYSCEIQIGSEIHAGAENIALGRLYNSTTTENGVIYYHWNSAQEIAVRTVEGWMESPGHRENILTAYWRQAGIGVVIGPGNQIYITQNFC